MDRKVDSWITGQVGNRYCTNKSIHRWTIAAISLLGEIDATYATKLRKTSSGPPEQFNGTENAFSGMRRGVCREEEPRDSLARGLRGGSLGELSWASRLTGSICVSWLSGRRLLRPRLLEIMVYWQCNCETRQLEQGSVKSHLTLRRLQLSQTPDAILWFDGACGNAREGASLKTRGRGELSITESTMNDHRQPWMRSRPT